MPIGVCNQAGKFHVRELRLSSARKLEEFPHDPLYPFCLTEDVLHRLLDISRTMLPCLLREHLC
jgi:hypothetical protein